MSSSRIRDLPLCPRCGEQRCHMSMFRDCKGVLLPSLFHRDSVILVSYAYKPDDA